MSNAETADEAAFRQHGLDLVAAVDDRIGPWLTAVVASIAGAPTEGRPEIVPTIEAAIDDVAANVHRSLTELAVADVDLALSGPLERIRQSMAPLNAALLDAGTPIPARDPVDIEMRPDDVFGIGPYTFMDLGERVHNAGITWGAAKAFLHAQRRRR